MHKVAGCDTDVGKVVEKVALSAECSGFRSLTSLPVALLLFYQTAGAQSGNKCKIGGKKTTKNPTHIYRAVRSADRL